MRLWTLHPKYLDATGLVALWRESLLAQKVLQGGTKGYQHHPQLTRFRESPDPLAAIAAYLTGILEEARQRGYAFDGGKIASAASSEVLDETEGQLLYEWQHLKIKLSQRDPERGQGYLTVEKPTAHPLFRIIAGGVQSWERVKD